MPSDHCPLGPFTVSRVSGNRDQILAELEDRPSSALRLKVEVEAEECGQIVLRRHQAFARAEAAGGKAVFVEDKVIAVFKGRKIFFIAGQKVRPAPAPESEFTWL